MELHGKQKTLKLKWSNSTKNEGIKGYESNCICYENGKGIL